MGYLQQRGQATQKKTPQSKAIPGREKDMSKNNAGGFAFTADSFMRMERFLILGSEGGTYYVSEHKLTEENLNNVRACIATDGLRAVQLIVDISISGRAPKNDPALYALALAASYGTDLKVREAALAALPKVARIGTHLFTFCSFIDTMRGWGPALRRAVANWYLDKRIDKLAYQLVKYQSRAIGEGQIWSHRDVLRVAHPNPEDKPDHKSVLRWAMKGLGDTAEELRLTPFIPELVQAFEEAKTADEKRVIELIYSNGLTREMIPTQYQKSAAVWDALVSTGMPITALIRSLGQMSAVGLLAPLSVASKVVCERLEDRDELREKRVHPIQILSALLTYKSGHGARGKLKWTPVPQIVDALDAAFYTAFELVDPTGKRFYLGIDVSSSMASGSVAGVPGMTPNMGAAAMAMLIARTEPNYFIGGFATSFVDLKISRSDSLANAMKKCQRSFGGTDCAIAIEHAQTHKYPVDAFVVITDGETWAGDIHASQALVGYREKTGLDSKLIVINMVANRTRLTDPTDKGSLDIVGFDTAVPLLINDFIGAENTVVSAIAKEEDEERTRR